jgi:hypothetical protein
MANADFSMGFKPVMSLTGGPPVILPNTQKSDGSAAIYPGDALKRNGSGRWLTLTAVSDNPQGVAGNYVAVSDTTTELKVYGLRETIFEAQVDDGSITDDTQLGNYFDLTVTTGDTTRLISKQEVDGDASAEDTLVLWGKVNRPDNAWGTNVNVYVKFRVDADADVIANT